MKRYDLGTNYIYSIKVNGRTYIGQTEAKSGTSRVLQHIINAYRTNRKNPKKTDLYDRMRQVKIMDLDIHLYYEPDYGIPDFQTKYQQFCAQWIPSAGSLKKNGSDIAAEVSPIDFAEIYHIMWLEHTNKKLFNAEMGGKVRGITFAGNTEQQTILSASTPPAEAYQAFKRGPEIYNEIVNETKQLYKYVFAKDWPSNIESKYNVKVTTPGATESWKEYCEDKLFKVIPEMIKECLGNDLTIVKDKFQKKIRKHIKTHFVEPRRNAIAYLIEQLMTSKNTESKNNRFHFKEEDFDVSGWADYLSQAFRGLVVKAGDQIFANLGYVTAKGKKSLAANIVDMVPGRITFSWSWYGKERKGAPWLTSAPVGEAIDTNVLKYESYLLFDNVYRDCKHDLKPAEHITSSYTWEDDQGNAIRTESSTSLANALKTDVVYLNYLNIETLSQKMRKEYEKRCPSYLNNWFDFYKPMVAVWRELKNKPTLTREVVNDKQYYYYINENGLAIVYKFEPNVPEISGTLAQLKIY